MTAPEGSPARTSWQRGADGFGRLATMLALAGLLVALGLAVVPAVLDRGSDSGTADYRPLAPAAPVRIDISGPEQVAPVLATDVAPSTTLTGPPVDAPLVTWWSGSAKPGADAGPTVLTAHTASHRGALTAIEDLGPGAYVDLLTKAGTLRYRIDRVRSYTEQSYADVATGLYRQSGGSGRLVMVSAQEWDGVDYQTFVVAVATPLGEPQ